MARKRKPDDGKKVSAADEAAFLRVLRANKQIAETEEDEGKPGTTHSLKTKGDGAPRIVRNNFSLIPPIQSED